MKPESSNSEWTSRRRLLTALEGGIPDRVPINTYELAGLNSLDWYNQQPSYRGLMDYIRARTDCITNWNPQPAGDRYIGTERFLCSDHPVEIKTRAEKIGSSTRTTHVCHTPKGDLRSVTQVDPRLYTTWNLEHWCKNTEDVDRALSVPYEPARYDASDYPRVSAELGDHGIVMASLGDPAYLAADLMSFQDFLVWAFEETEHYARTVETVAERVMENLRRQLACCPVDLYRICGPEYMTPPYLPPSMFERFMVPHLRKMTELVHAAGRKVRLHCHGRIGRVLDLILETGVDGIDPCEPPPDGDLELDKVKRRCQAHNVSVWGNIELKLLEQGDPRQVRAEVRRIMDQAKAGGGFVLLPTAAPINVPLSPRTEENYRAFIDAGLEFGQYQ
ncbi:MAG: uroporphyrinogen decarboxylase family protein [Candidatus Omnitrophica bacterium]|nr:uroporphyrinogen decarboxylase family protein [Candidatus Omnitrophota bacterium]